ncbi:hypothetical protein NM208_g7564 [Fusarium decemcellulare]|uniref:Uncharacterized protein n=2 Tax=Fusarium decemcellulare TaxID=57161 RepID=A0ACC1S8P2_9HYPO|nr:hypothetical protein NM208_g7564 [Fusarium decemcellulare]
MCGIMGVSLGSYHYSATADLVESALQLQHRGQDACGIVCGTLDGIVSASKGNGLVTEVFSANNGGTLDLEGSFGIGHATNGKHTVQQIQPIIAKDRGNIAIAHNGNLENCMDIARYLNTAREARLSPSLGDSELMMELFLPESARNGQIRSSNPIPRWVLSGIEEIYRHSVGSFACVLFVPSYGLVAFRDPHGIKPLAMGRRVTTQGEVDYMFASESVAFQNLGYTFLRDVNPGEAIFVPSVGSIPENTRCIAMQIVPELSYSPDVFEMVYFARQESVIDGVSVNRSRQLMGEELAQTVIDQLANTHGHAAVDEIDCVIPVPETSYTCALALSQAMGKPLSLGLVRNRFIMRTFIIPNQKQRCKAVNRKLNTVGEEFDGKNVLIVDDSIVRGTTAARIVKMTREAGANKVYFASGSPAIRYRHIYGIDLADEKELLAHGQSNTKIQAALGCDGLYYLPLEGLVRACNNARGGEGPLDFEVGIFTGSYTTHKSGHHRYEARPLYA